MGRAALLLLIACGAAPIEAEPEPLESAVPMPCELRGGMLPDEVEADCGTPTSKIYSPAAHDAVTWSYCNAKPCKLRRFLIVFSGGKTMAYGPIYEVAQ